jgi:1-acyl-sn-glycerol-3-phosphate acyltransferase
VSELASLIYTGYVAMLAIVTLPPVWMVLRVMPAGPAADRLVRRWSRFMVRASGCRLFVTGLDHLEGSRSQPAMLVSNHRSYIDSIVLMAALRTPWRFVADDEVLTWPAVATAVRKARHLTVDRTSKDARLACTAAMAQLLREGESVLVYPEGSRSRRHSLLPFRLGAFRAAVDAGRPIVPIALSGTRAIFTPGRWRFRPGAIAVSVGEPIAPATRDRAEMVRLRDAARAAIESALENAPVQNVCRATHSRSSESTTP